MAANAGVEAEKKVRSALDKMALRSDFTFDRFYDAKSAKGAMSAPQSGDFQAFHGGLNWLLEVKSVEHDFRLPRKNFEDGQIGRMYKRQLAGSYCFVLFYSKTRKTWRALPLDYFLHDRPTGSWNLTDIPEEDLSTALGRIFIPMHTLVPIGRI